MATIWLDGEWHDRDTAKVSVYDHGLLYGDGVFEGIRVYAGKVFRLAEHVDRLYDSARALWLEVPMPREELAGIIEEAVRRSGLAEAYIRPIVTRGVGDLGLDPRKCVKPSVIVIVDGIRMWSANCTSAGCAWSRQRRRFPSASRSHPASSRSITSPHILARIEGINAGADEVLMLDSAGQVAEGSGENVFVVQDGRIRTPPAYAGILKGVTRDVVIELARGAGYEVHEEILNRYDVYTADKAFFTGTAAEVVAIRELDGRTVGAGHRGPVTADLAERYRALTRE